MPPTVIVSYEEIQMKDAAAVIQVTASQKPMPSSRRGDVSFSVQGREIVDWWSEWSRQDHEIASDLRNLRPTARTVRVGGHDIEKEPVAAKISSLTLPDTIHRTTCDGVTEHLHFIALAYRIKDAEKKY